MLKTTIDIEAGTTISIGDATIHIAKVGETKAQMLIDAPPHVAILLPRRGDSTELKTTS